MFTRNIFFQQILIIFFLHSLSICCSTVVKELCENKESYITSEKSTEIIPVPYDMDFRKKLSSLYSCDNGESEGHILYLQKTYNENNDDWVSDLWIMDGDGNDNHLVMRNVQGVPGWSLDGKKISVDCSEGNQGYICILDAIKTVDSCLGKEEDDECLPVILEKHAFPVGYPADSIEKISWFADGKRLFIEIKDDKFILSTDLSDEWFLFSDSNRSFSLSPVADEYLMSGMIKIYSDGIHLKKYDGISGDFPAWSWDGKKAAFLYYPDQDNLQKSEPAGIMQLTFIEGYPKLAVLYDPKPINGFYSYQENLFLGEYINYPIFSWSPSGRYLAFSADYGEHKESHLFRLDSLTGEICQISNHVYVDTIKEFYGPSWGP